MAGEQTEQFPMFHEGDVLFTWVDDQIEVYRYRSLVEVIPVTLLRDENGRITSRPIPMDSVSDSAPEALRKLRVKCDLSRTRFRSIDEAKAAATGKLDWVVDVVRDPSEFTGRIGGILVRSRKE